MLCEVVEVTFDHPSFSWGNGTYFILKENEFDYYLVRLDNGVPQTYDDGRFMETITSKKNKGVKRTRMFFETDEKRYERIVKTNNLLRNE